MLEGHTNGHPQVTEIFWRLIIYKHNYCGFIYFHGYLFSWIAENLYIRGYLISWFCQSLHTKHNENMLCVEHLSLWFTSTNETHENWYPTNNNESTVKYTNNINIWNKNSLKCIHKSKNMNMCYDCQWDNLFQQRPNDVELSNYNSLYGL